MMSGDSHPLVGRVLAGDRRALARSISMLEDGDPEVPRLVRELYPHTGNAVTVGFTGPPGVGKSSVIARLIKLYRTEGRSVGVVSVDPSSPFSRGALLGDRVRLADHFLDKEVFIRSMGSRGHLGGLAAGARLAALAMEAYGCDVVIYETVGVGQGEVEVAAAAETVVLVLQPGAGDAVQAMKAGVMEVADVLCVNKADHPGAKGLVAEVRGMLEIGHELDPEAPIPRIVTTRGDTGEGVADLKEAIEDHREALLKGGRMEARRRESSRELVLALARAGTEKDMEARLDAVGLAGRVAAREIDPVSAAGELRQSI